MNQNNKQQQPVCYVHVRDDATGNTRCVSLPAPMTLQHFRSASCCSSNNQNQNNNHFFNNQQGGNSPLSEVSAVVECDPSSGAPLKRTLIMSQPNDVLQPGRHYIARRHATQTNTPAVSFSSMATVREYSLSFIHHQNSPSLQNQNHSPPSNSINNNNNNQINNMIFPLEYEFGGSKHFLTENELDRILQRDYVNEAKGLDSELEKQLNSYKNLVGNFR